MKNALLTIFRWVIIAPCCISSYIIAYTIAYWLLKFSTAPFLPDTLKFLLSWPNSGIASCVLVFLAFVLAPTGKPIAAFVSFALNIAFNGLYIALVMHGKIVGISVIQSIMELLGALLGGGCTAFYIITHYARRGYSKVMTIEGKSQSMQNLNK